MAQMHLRSATKLRKCFCANEAQMAHLLLNSANASKRSATKLHKCICACELKCANDAYGANEA
jgi:hypothetical protein